MDIPGAAVVAKALPLVEHLAFLSPGQAEILGNRSIQLLK